ncbi:proteasome complex subunit Rpn13 ubiquitin receptor-domain-containing protein [Lineolata rhizophorae]|uniref:Proteasome complex subunit Rpn13 ubiquitin receptor-domain-containing protein n=1 Tax=Lineolata rhizophorae TaxID=578093 RepID=A0A6A6P4Y5_9PEZI|nr:proteasome complex subunit Rpn13 ubiquitin receptor-domain-containing protein [Lineolata rhizophorae]
MSIQPIITFKAGKCDMDSSSPPNIKADPTPGYIYLCTDGDGLTHFCWRARSSSASSPEIDLIMFPGDGSFVPYLGKAGSADGTTLRSPTNGRVFALKFSSSSQRHLFWLQSAPQAPNKENPDPSLFSPRDEKIGQIVDLLLRGEEVDVAAELREARDGGGGGGREGDGDDDVMEDVQPSASHGGSGGAGADATGGDVREEGEEAREGGADGARA